MTYPVGIAEAEKLEHTKNARTCFTFNDFLPNPYDVIPPRDVKPDFVAPDGWLDDVEAEIVAQLQRSDEAVDSDDGGNATLYRVPPMAVVRCSRGGKTRALYEIANKMHGYNALLRKKVATLYVSFNDYSAVEKWENDSPLQALLRRIVYMAVHNDARQRNLKTFDVFVNKKHNIEPRDFLEWLGDSTTCVLIVDELNNLDELLRENSLAAVEFAKFVKQHFMAVENRYFVFSSHQVSTVEFFSLFVDPSKGSVRPVVLQELPIADTLTKALKLKSTLDSAREAIYYGLLPGLIYYSPEKNEEEELRNNQSEENVKKPERSLRDIVGKRQIFTRQFLNNSQNLDRDFKDILRSLICGDSDLVPKELHMLLDTAGNEDGISVIRWVPFHLSFVMSRLAMAHDFSYNHIAGRIGKLCDDLRDSKRFSGEGWEAIFVLFLLARCLTKLDDEFFVPRKWFLEDPKVLYNEPYQSNKQLLFSECENWQQLLKGVTPGDKPQLSILFPTHSRFKDYDVLAVYSEGGQNKSIYGYQLNEGATSIAHSASVTIEKSFWVQGKSPKSPKEQKNWLIPHEKIIDTFYGESGKHWTPKKWSKFMATKHSG